MTPEILALAAERTALEMRDRVREFASRREAIIASAVDRGMLHSGGTQGQISEAIRVEYECRARRTWQILADLGDVHDWARDDSSATQLKTYVASTVDSHVSDLAAAHDQAAGFLGSPDGLAPLEESRQEALAKANVEIDTALHLAGRQSPNPPANVPQEILELKPGIWGFSINLRALWQRFTRRKV